MNLRYYGMAVALLFVTCAVGMENEKEEERTTNVDETKLKEDIEKVAKGIPTTQEAKDAYVNVMNQIKPVAEKYKELKQTFEFMRTLFKVEHEIASLSTGAKENITVFDHVKAFFHRSSVHSSGYVAGIFKTEKNDPRISHVRTLLDSKDKKTFEENCRKTLNPELAPPTMWHKLHAAYSIAAQVSLPLLLCAFLFVHHHK